MLLTPCPAPGDPFSVTMRTPTSSLVKPRSQLCPICPKSSTPGGLNGRLEVSVPVMPTHTSDAAGGYLDPQSLPSGFLSRFSGSAGHPSTSPKPLGPLTPPFLKSYGFYIISNSYVLFPLSYCCFLIPTSAIFPLGHGSSCLTLGAVLT